MRNLFLCVALVATFSAPALQAAEPPAPLALYREVKAFEVAPESLPTEMLVLRRDRVELTFDGEFYFAQPIDGRVYGAVFFGRGSLRLEPHDELEKENVRRLLKSDLVEATFKRAVLRFSDDTFAEIGPGRRRPGRAAEQARQLAARLEERLLRETGLNLSARLALSVLHDERPGLFFGEFDGGNRGRFTVLLDYQGRTLQSIFGLNAGEKGIVFHYRYSTEPIDIWTAFPSLADLAQGVTDYTDAYDLVAIPDYRMEIDLTQPDKWLRMNLAMGLVALQDGLQLVPFDLNEGLRERDKERLNKGVKVLHAELPDHTSLGFIQEPWETGVSLVLPRPLRKDEKITALLRLEGKDTLWTWEHDFHYLRSRSTWYPRHGYLRRSRFDLTFRHRRRDTVVSVGAPETQAPERTDERYVFTRHVMAEPVHHVTFAVGLFLRRTQEAEVDGKKVLLEVYTPSHISWQGIGEPFPGAFLLQELDNSVRYFSALYGAYPYARLAAVYTPAWGGQSFPTLLFLPPKLAMRTIGHHNEFPFIAHEVSHQWWGNLVGWRTHRDAWLSEGLAQYSGILFTWRREKQKQAQTQVNWNSEALRYTPWTELGAGQGQVHEVAPLTFGSRLRSRQTGGAYFGLVYAKGALVLRMLHYLLSDPRDGNPEGFTRMMTDFAQQHAHGWATTEDFQAVASRHFAQSPIAQDLGLTDLDWFFRQWVYGTGLPSYHLEYRLVQQADQTLMLEGTLYQDDVSEDWATPLPLVFEFEGDRKGEATLWAVGAATPVYVRLTETPKKVELDPEMWVLSAKTSEKKID